ATLGENTRGFRRHILELIGHDIDAVGKAPQGGLVFIVGAGDMRRNFGGRRIFFGGIDMDVKAQFGRRACEHTTELSTTKNADRAAGGDDAALVRHEKRYLSSGARPTEAVCLAR